MAHDDGAWRTVLFLPPAMPERPDDWDDDDTGDDE